MKCYLYRLSDVRVYRALSATRREVGKAAVCNAHASQTSAYVIFGLANQPVIFRVLSGRNGNNWNLVWSETNSPTSYLWCINWQIYDYNSRYP